MQTGIWILLLALCASFVQRTIGFGFGIFIMTMLPLLLPSYAEATTVSDVTLDSRVLSNFGVEADIVGMIMGMKEGEEIGPVAGNACAFIIKNVKFTAPAETTDYSSVVREKTSQYSNRAMNNGVYNALRNDVKIKDNRTEIF